MKDEKVKIRGDYEVKVLEYSQVGNRFSWQAIHRTTRKRHDGKFYPTNGAAQVALQKWINRSISTLPKQPKEREA